ncbi:MAG: molybdopterin molybdotransferase MoeA [Acidobacteriia bacterium]|nr:molybdopterin molybdotransferase MoeA [Terriglobia bacterium]
MVSAATTPSRAYRWLIRRRENALPEFLKVITSDQFVERLGCFPRLASERVSLGASLRRVLAEDVVATEDLPERARSTVDGYAVHAVDTFGASDSMPALLEVVAAVEMGTMPDFAIRAGQAAHIPTGGFLPAGADAVVMVEYTNPAGGNRVEVTRPLTVGTNVLEKGEDVKAGESVIRAGRALRPQELGLLAALGVTHVRVYRRPRVAVISTGDEVVPIDRTPKPGQIRDANTYSISALVRAVDGEPKSFDIVPDDGAMLGGALENGLAQADIVVVSGGSSVGTRDLMVDVVAALPGVEVRAHGVAIRPGKPTLLARQKGKAIFGLPGHPVSALIVAQAFLAPFLKYLQGGRLEKGPLGQRVKAVLSTSIHSTVGLEEFVRVFLEEASDGGFFAQPVFGKSGMLSTMVKASGIVVVPMHVEGFAQGEVVEVIRM